MFDSKIIRQLAIALVFFVSLFVTADVNAPPTGDVPYAESDFTVGVSEKHTIAVNLEAGHIIEGDFSISGQEDYIDFYIKDPYGGLLYDVNRAGGGLQFTSKAAYSGVHTLYFDNSFAWDASRQISLRYRVR